MGLREMGAVADMRDDQKGRPAPVSPELYTREYFTTDCEGYHLMESGCEALPERIEEALAAAGDLEGRWVLDVGCGRGELACEAARRGAYAVGIDYAPAAVELSMERRGAMKPPERERVEFRLANAKGLDFPDRSFDVVFLIDVYEHLHPYEIEHTLDEIRRVLRPWGILVVHTGPNTWFYRLGYPLVRAAARLLLRRELPEDLRGQYDDVMHVNEQSPLSLYRGLASGGFRARVMPRSFLVGIRPNRWEKAAMGILFARPMGYIFCTSLMATATLREGGREAQLRAARVARMLAPRRGAGVLLVGEAEGALAGLLADLAGVEVTWLEALAEEARGAAAVVAPGTAEGKAVAGHQDEMEYTRVPGRGSEGEQAVVGPPGGGAGFCGSFQAAMETGESHDLHMRSDDGSRVIAASSPRDRGSAAGAHVRMAGDPYRLPFPDASFDAVASQFLLEQLRDPAAAVREMTRVLKPGGVLALVTRNARFRGAEPRPTARPRHPFTPRELARLAQASGLWEARAATLLPDLKLPVLYRGDLAAFMRLERLPWISARGRLLFLRAVKPHGAGRG